MNRTKARLSFVSHLEEFFGITYKEEILFEHGIYQAKLTFDPELYRCAGTNNLYIEGCIHWYPDVARVNIYYSLAGAQVVAKNKDNFPALFRVFNFISSEVWPLVDDTTGIDYYYTPTLLYCPRIFLSEDNKYDICMSFLFHYNFLDAMELQTWDFILHCCPYLMQSWAPSIFNVVQGHISAERAIEEIQNKLHLKNSD